MEMKQLELQPLDFGTEEKVVRFVGPTVEVNFIFAKNEDGELIGFHIDDENPEYMAKVKKILGEAKLTPEGHCNEMLFDSGFSSHCLYISEAFQRYSDSHLKLIIAPYEMVESVMVVCESVFTKMARDHIAGLPEDIREAINQSAKDKGKPLPAELEPYRKQVAAFQVDSPSHRTMGLDLGIRLEMNNGEWKYQVWSLGSTPFTYEERSVIRDEYVILHKVVVFSKPEDLKYLVEKCKPITKLEWFANSEKLTQIVLDYLVGTYKTF
jgi:hypothetical protein